MKKTLLICFLALLCIAGSETQAKVASPRDSLPSYPTFTGQEGHNTSVPKEGNLEASYTILLYVQSTRKPLCSLISGSAFSKILLMRFQRLRF